MHEVALANAIVDTALRHAGGRRVTEVQLRVGALRQVVPASLEFHFGVVAQDTACAGARLRQELVPARVRCEACEVEALLTEPSFRCAACGAAPVSVVEGEELEVESIEVEEVAPACTE